MRTTSPLDSDSESLSLSLSEPLAKEAFGSSSSSSSLELSPPLFFCKREFHCNFYICTVRSAIKTVHLPIS